MCCMSQDGDVSGAFIDDDYSSEFEAAQYMHIPNGYGEHVERLTETAHDTVHRLYQKVLEKNSYGGDSDVEALDAEIRRLTTREVPTAFNDVGNHISQAREFEEDIAEDRFYGESNAIEWGLSQDERPEKEQDFLENYREAESHYRSLFEALDSSVGDETLVEFVGEEYGIDLLDIIPEVPEPRPDVR